MADPYLGTRTQLSFGEETTPGTKASTSVTQFGLVNSADLPDEEIDWLKFWNIGSGRDYNQAVEGKHILASSLPVTIQSGLPLFYAFGKETCVGTAVGGGGASTLNGALAVGDTTVNVVSATGYSVNDYIQIDVTTSAEVRKITAIVTNALTIDKGVRLAHLTGVACGEVIAPYTHKLSLGNSLKSFTLEGAQLADTNFVRHFDGCYMGTMDIGCAEESALETTLGLKAMKTEASGTSASTVTPSGTVPFMFNNGVITQHGGALTRTTSFKLNMDNKIKEKHYIQSSNARYPYEYIIGRRVIDISVTAVADAKTWWDFLKTPGAATTFSAKFSRSATDYIDIQATDVRLKSGPHKFPEEGEISVDLSYIAQTCSAEVMDAIPYYWAI